MRATISTTGDMDLLDAAKKVGILRSQALDFGLWFLMAERGLCEHPQNSLSKKIERMAEHLNAKVEE